MTLATSNPSSEICEPGTAASPAGTARPRARRSGLMLAARLAVSFGLLAALLSQIELGGVFAIAAGARVELLAVLLTLFIGERCLGAYRWHLLLRAQNTPVSFATTLRATLLGGFVGTFLPGGVGVEAVRVAAMTRAANLASAASSVLVDRILGSLALVAIVLITLSYTSQRVPTVVPVAAWTALAVLVGMSLVLLHPRLRRTLQRFVPGRRRGYARRELCRFAKAVRQLRKQPGAIVRVGGLSVLFQVLRVSIAPVAALALGIDIPLTLLLIYVPIIMFIMMLPISIGGLGVREASYVYFFGLEHITAEQALAMSLLIGLFTLLVQLPGAAVCVTGVRPRKRRAGSAGDGAPTVPSSQEQG